MEFIYYSDKTVRQCQSALTDRMEAKPTKTRPAMDGHIEKGGKFSLSVTTPVGGRFYRKTKLRGSMSRESGTTIIQGHVPSGMPRERVIIIMVMAIVVGLLVVLGGGGIFGILVAMLGAGLYIPLVGDYNNSDTLLKEVKRATNGKDKPPK
ncbi:MAG: hypothetical protein KC496_06530 [Anaerolineae bacterium]|nr:hypothetical protein [Anaerolineae bacterium]